MNLKAIMGHFSKTRDLKASVSQLSGVDQSRVVFSTTAFLMYPLVFMNYFRLIDAFSISCSGKHAERYLQARLTQDVKNLPVGNAMLAAALSPQGKTEGIFCVKRQSADSFILLSFGGNPATIIESLLRYKVADQFSIATSIETKEQFWLTTAPEAPCHQQGTSLCLSLSPSTPTVCITTHPPTHGSLGSEEELLKFRLLSMLPLFPKEIGENELFPEASLPWYVSHQKGCYTGQEVLEKIDSHGKAPYHLVRVKITSSYAPPTPCLFLDKDKNVGTLRSIVTISDRCFGGFAMIKNGIEVQTLRLQNQEATIELI